MWTTRLLIIAALVTPHAARASSDPQLVVLKYDSPGWNPRPTALRQLAWEIKRRTSVELDVSTATVAIDSDDIFRYPLLVLHGDREFAPLPRQAIRNLGRHLSAGGLLWIDGSEGLADGGFERSARRMLERVFPGSSLAPLSAEHVLLKSFYLVDRFGGRVLARPYVEAILLGDRVAVILGVNDHAGAYAKDDFGNWTYRVSGGERQREMALRFGLNVVLYALCLDYKTDQVHIPFILKRRR